MTLTVRKHLLTLDYVCRVVGKQQKWGLTLAFSNMVESLKLVELEMIGPLLPLWVLHHVLGMLFGLWAPSQLAGRGEGRWPAVKAARQQMVKRRGASLNVSVHTDTVLPYRDGPPMG